MASDIPDGDGKIDNLFFTVYGCNIFWYYMDLKRECHEIIVSIHLYRILVHFSPKEMLYKALVGDCS